MHDDILVSISCITYNHEDYIETALLSFLAQECDFKFEILIHDDCSTDNTADIIRKYEAMYPGIIKPIYQSINQYSIGITNVSERYNFSRAKGKYIALCEGDDYWTDNKKLQKQIDLLEKHPDYSLCLHAAKAIAVDSSYPELSIRPYKRSKELTAEEVIDKKSAYATASLVFPTILVLNLPEFYRTSPVGDIPLQIILASKGKSYYIDEYMSVYRVGVGSSWTISMQKGAYEEKQEKYYRDIKSMYEAFDAYSNYKYTKTVQNAILRIRYLTYVNTKNYKEILSTKYKTFFKELSFRSRFFIKLEYIFPQLYDFMRKIALKIKA